MGLRAFVYVIWLDRIPVLLLSSYHLPHLLQLSISKLQLWLRLLLFISMFYSTDILILIDDLIYRRIAEYFKSSLSILIEVLAFIWSVVCCCLFWIVSTGFDVDE